jgi:hypothetical protein
MLSNAGDRWPTVTGTLLPISKFCVAVVLHRPYGRRTDCRNRVVHDLEVGGRRDGAVTGCWISHPAIRALHFGADGCAAWYPIDSPCACGFAFGFDKAAVVSAGKVITQIAEARIESDFISVTSLPIPNGPRAQPR